MPPNRVYYTPETPTTFSSAGDVVITLHSPALANNAGRVSAQWDRGAGAKPGKYRWEFKTTLAVAGTVGNMVTLYLATAQATAADVDGNVGQVDAALSALDKRRNLQFVGAVEVDVAATTMLKGSGEVDITSRFASLVVVNESGQAFSGTTGDHLAVLTPIPAEIQA